MIAKPSRLSRLLRKFESRQAKRRRIVSEQKARVAEWRLTSLRVKTRDLGTCRICGLQTRSSGHPAYLGAAHHLVWRSAGGPDTLDNLIWTCAACHEAIHAHLVNVRGAADLIYVEDNR